MAGVRAAGVRLLAGVLLGLGAGGLLVLVRPDLVGLAGTEPVAQLVALRGVQALALAAGTLVLAAVGGVLLRAARGTDGRTRARRRRGATVVLACAAVLGLAAAGHVAVLAARGVDGSGPGERAEADLVVLSFNTFDAVTAAEIAELVAAQDADVAVLPETSGDTARAAARALTSSGRPTTALAADAAGTRVEGTALLVRAGLGAFDQVTEGLPATDLGTFAAVPAVAGSGDVTAPTAPTLVAAHLRAPSARASMPEWRAHTAAIAAVCGDAPGVVVAGDLNATLDHPGLRDLGPCVDAAEQAGAAGLGTWPAQAPPALGAPIDHVLVDGRAWRVTGFAVLRGVGGGAPRPGVAPPARR
ncbi:endonuclease/exonuclease/phosphatase family protein [Cellulomonas endometrii]|uniref:endonuclease/exonuclease/phosphatase family protein n=1 Tax=Cellulomonas endometrii TaxID=3036301 RepID=UPI0024ADD642|nr:endonuclease/exonuclease/phosphatase family protein [Cellulomonas endometrii]